MIRQLVLGRLSVALLEQLVHGEAARAQGGEEHEAAAHGEVDCEVLGDAQQPLPICHHRGAPPLPHEHRLRHGEHGKRAGDARGPQPQGEGQAEQELRHAEAEVVVPVSVVEGGEGRAQQTPQLCRTPPPRAMR